MFHDKNVLITGGNSGIGKAVAQRFSELGANVFIVGRNQETLTQTANQLGGNVVPLMADVRNKIEREQLFRQVESQVDQLDVLVVNAGTAQFTPIDLVDESFYDLLFDTNVKGAYFTIQNSLPLMKRGSSIILMSSVAKDKGIPGASVYSATKAALSSIAKTLAAELTPLGIRVNSVSPGPIETPIFDKMAIPADQVPIMKSSFADMVPLKRLGRSDEVADAVQFLASSASSYVLGIDLAVDGGLAQV